MEQSKCEERNRKKNYSEEHKLFLVDLTKVYNDVEIKGYDQESLKKKEKAWDEILTKFTARFPGLASMESLKGLWKRIKMKTKSDIDKQRKDYLATGIGDPTKDLDPISEGCSAVLGDSILPLENDYDDDAPTTVAVLDRSPRLSFLKLPKPKKRQKKARTRKQGEPSTKVAKGDPLLRMAEKKHKIRMNVLLLKEWKLQHECMRDGFGLPEGYFPSGSEPSYLEQLHDESSSSSTQE